MEGILFGIILGMAWACRMVAKELREMRKALQELQKKSHHDSR